jgi:hypothetical protein
MHAVLRGVPIGRHTHLLARGPDADAEVLAEKEADLLACELLAPAEVVLARPVAGLGQLIGRLVTRFGLPHPQAVRHAGRLRPSLPPPHPLVEKWRR